MLHQRPLPPPYMAKSTNPKSSTSCPPPSLAALPSMTHSLASLPTMSALPHDMLHYNSALHSRARMENALQKQRQQGATQQPLAAFNPNYMSRTPSPSANEDALIMMRRQQAGRPQKSHDRR
ncbi:hypothetical protein V8B97DRAFT_582977 [Scleroderma yunnanense]